jgi:hydrogenase expression/formation protein HypE
MTTTILQGGLACPAPITTHDCVVVGHGSGGKLSARLIEEHFLPHFRGDALAQLGDASLVSAGGARLAVSTDTFVVSPLEFRGGNIGDLAVNGTVNDLAMMGAIPLYLTVGFILEEGLPFDVLDRVIASMAAAARAADVQIIAGDTKVVERGKGDGMFINTTGIGIVNPDFRPAPDKVVAGDVVIVSGDIGVHGMTILAERDGIGFEADLASDTAALHKLVQVLREFTGGDVHALRDPTRGGVASTLNEIAKASGVGIELREESLPIPPVVQGACEMLGLDPLYVANEGLLVAFVPAEVAGAALEALRAHPLGRHAAAIGKAVREHPGMVVLRTGMGGTRIVDMLPGDQLPRIC